MLAVGPMRNATSTKMEEGAVGRRIGGGPIIMLHAPALMCDAQAEHSPHSWLGWAGLYC